MSPKDEAFIEMMKADLDCIQARRDRNLRSIDRTYMWQMIVLGVVVLLIGIAPLIAITLRGTP